MNFSSLKNISPLYFYLVSMICFVLANVVRDQTISFYYALLLVGVMCCVAGFLLRIKSKH